MAEMDMAFLAYRSFGENFGYFGPEGDQEIA